MDNASSAKVIPTLDERIEKLVKTKESIEKSASKFKFNPVTKEDLEKLNFADDLAKLKAIQRERLLEDLSTLLNDKIKELEHKDTVLSELTTALNEKIEQIQLEKKHSDELNNQLKSTLKKLSEAELQLKVERDWLAEQVEKKSLEVLKTIEQLMKAENAKK